MVVCLRRNPLTCILLLCQVIQIWAFSGFQDRIPNGHVVPHPCRVNYIWHGVGHINKDGGGERNIFGKAFEAAGKQWTKQLCEADTDGDGMTNGEELGDPSCIWIPGEVPARLVNISHPGICDEFRNLDCFEKNQWVDCSNLDFLCDAVNEKDVKSFTARVNNKTVPNEETTYVCSLIDLPVDNDYHLIALEPIIDNRRVVHHMVLFGCDPSKDEDISVPSDTPYICGMVPHRHCQTVLMVWTLGLNGQCLDDTIGIRIGQYGYRKGAIQIHWNNPEKASDMMDSSGMKFYYTPNRRPSDMTVFVVGQNRLEIPPQQNSMKFTGECSGQCTEIYLSEPIYLVSVLNHMHYLGREANVEINRNGTLIARIGVDDNYHYDDPKTHRVSPPLRILPGDGIQLSCTFNSESVEKTTYWGDGTSDEMCLTFLTVYPAQAVQKAMCVSYKSLPDCVMHSPVVYRYPYKECNYMNVSKFRDEEFNKIAEKVEVSCRPFGRCYSDCLEATESLFDHTCTKGDIWEHIVDRMLRIERGYELLIRLQTCRSNVTAIEKRRECGYRTSTSHVVVSSGLLLFFSFMMAKLQNSA